MIIKVTDSQGNISSIDYHGSSMNESSSVPNPKINIEDLLQNKGYIKADDYLKEIGWRIKNGK